MNLEVPIGKHRPESILDPIAGALVSIERDGDSATLSLSQRSDVRQEREDEFCVTHRIGGKEPGWSLAPEVLARLKAL